MQLRTTLPKASELALPANIATQVEQHLLAAFDSPAEAEAFWQQGYSRLILIEDNDNQSTLRALKQELRMVLLFAVEYPEHSETLGEYELSLSIIGSDGGGIYIVRTVALDNATLQEWLGDE